jgi:hypothetical protein
MRCAISYYLHRQVPEIPGAAQSGARLVAASADVRIEKMKET